MQINHESMIISSDNLLWLEKTEAHSGLIIHLMDGTVLRTDRKFQDIAQELVSGGYNPFLSIEDEDKTYLINCQNVASIRSFDKQNYAVVFAPSSDGEIELNFSLSFTAKTDIAIPGNISTLFIDLGATALYHSSAEEEPFQVCRRLWVNVERIDVNQYVPLPNPKCEQRAHTAVKVGASTYVLQMSSEDFEGYLLRSTHKLPSLADILAGDQVDQITEDYPSTSYPPPRGLVP